MSKVGLASVSVVVLLGVLVKLWSDHVDSLRRYMLPVWLSGHPVHFEENLVPAKAAEEMFKYLKDVGVLYTNAADTKWYDVTYEDVGEAEPMINGRCADPFLVPNKNRTACVLPGRVDVGRHYILTGGPSGLKEMYEDAVSRLLSFGIYNWDLSKDPTMHSLFTGEKFQNAAKFTCPKDKQYIDPFQGNYIVQLPGQTVAAHIDAPYFWGANRFQYPQWLLAVMVFSGLFEHIFVPQVQVVGYIHQWNPNEKELSEIGGNFIYWGDKKNVNTHNTKDGKVHVGSDTILPVPLAGVSVDGSKLVHAADVYYPNVVPPKIDKSRQTELRYSSSDDVWHLKVDNEIVKTYQNDDLRISIVFRARCHKDEAEAEKFRNQIYDSEKALRLEEDILEVLVKDMAKRGVVKSNALSAMPRKQLAMKMIDEYIRYPYPEKAHIPYNFCALSRLIPAATGILSLVC